MISTGCTVENSFKFPYEKSDVAALLVTYKCEDKIVVEKELSDCIIKEGRVYVKLSQEDTLAFPDNTLVKVQIRGRLKSGAVIKCKVINAYSDEVLNRKVI